MNDEEWLDGLAELAANRAMGDEDLLLGPEEYTRLIRLARKGLAAEKMHEALTARAFQRELEAEALAAYEAATEES